MNVLELIKLLLDLPRDAEVCLEVSEGFVPPLGEVATEEHCTGRGKGEVEMTVVGRRVILKPDLVR